MTFSYPILDSHNLMVGHKNPCTHPISFTIQKPGMYALIGPNGSGKSTFLKTLVGLIQPISGNFEISADRKLSYVPQAHAVNQYFHLSMYNFIVQGYGPKFKETEEIQETVKKFAEIWQLSDQMSKCFHELSGGQKTRAMIIRALISQPNLLFLDEPLASLDSCCQEQLMNALADLIKTQNACVIIADHHLEKFQHLITGHVMFEKRHDDALTYAHASLHS